MLFSKVWVGSYGAKNSAKIIIKYTIARKMSEVNASGRFFKYCQSFFIFASSYSFPYLILGSTMASRISLITIPMSTRAEINMLFARTKLMSS